MARSSANRHDVLPGTLDMLVLKILSSTSMHGYGIAQALQRLSREALKAEEGSLYPSLHRMRQKGWINAEWKQTANNQRARYYTVTAAGRKHLGAEEARFADLVAVITGVLRRA